MSYSCLRLVLSPTDQITQETQKQKEVGIVFRNLDNFGLTFKSGTNKSLWRFSTLLVQGSNFEETTDSVENKQSSRGFGVGFGREYRESISDKIELRFGAELLPNFGYITGTSVERDSRSDDGVERKTDISGFNYGLSNTSALLSLAYRF